MKRKPKPGPKPKKKAAAPAKVAAKTQAGRPTLKSADLCGRICSLIAEGHSLRAIGRMKDMPSAEAVREWLTKDEVFAAQYVRAREEQADHYADEIVAMADEAIGKDAAEVAARRLAVDARKWVASKLKPKKYGDKVDVEHSGAVTQRIEKIERTIVDPANPDG